MQFDVRFVTVFDLKTGTKTTIPAAELAPGMIQVKIEGEDGHVWINSRDATSTMKASPFQHPPFDKPTRGKLRKIMGILSEVRPLSFEEWEDGFRQDKNPEPQIDEWLYIATTYEEFLKEFNLGPKQKKELFNVLVQCSANPYEHISKVLELDALAPEIAKAAIEQYYGQPELKKQAALVPPIEYPAPDGSTPDPVEALMEPQAREALKDADLVFGVDSFTGETSLFYGKELLEKVINEHAPQQAVSKAYLYDSRTDQLEFLVAAVTVVKGSCCYPGAQP